MDDLEITRRCAALSAVVMTALLAGCDAPQGPTVDQCMRREIFKECMASLPAGPRSTVTNDWDEVVSTCGNQAYYQSLRGTAFIKPECRP